MRLGRRQNGKSGVFPFRLFSHSSRLEERKKERKKERKRSRGCAHFFFFHQRPIEQRGSGGQKETKDYRGVADVDGDCFLNEKGTEKTFSIRVEILFSCQEKSIIDPPNGRADGLVWLTIVIVIGGCGCDCCCCCCCPCGIPPNSRILVGFHLRIV